MTCSIAAFGYAHRSSVHGPTYPQIIVPDPVKTARSSADLKESALKIQMEEINKQSLSSGLMLEFEELSVGEMALPIDSENFEKKDGAAISKDFRDAVIDTTGHELNHLRTVVTAMREKEMKIRTQLMESVCPLKEQLESHVDLEVQLTEKDLQIKTLSSQISSLEVFNKKALQELSGKENLEQDLQMAKIKINELHREKKNDASQRQTHLQILKQQLGKLQEIQHLNSQKEIEHEKNLLILKDLEAEVEELRQGIKKMSQDSHELAIEVAAANKRIAEIPPVTEIDTPRHDENESSQLRHSYDNMSKQVEEDQARRFREVEELVYLRWVNACLQYELDMHKASCETPTASDHDESNSPGSLHSLKESMLRSIRPALIPLNVKEEGASNSEIVFSPSPRRPCIDSASTLRFSPKKQGTRKNFLRSFSSLSSDSETSNTSPKPRRTSLQIQEIHRNVIRSSSSLSSDSEISDASPKQRRHSSSSSILEAYLQRNAGETGTRDFNIGTSRFSSSASFGSRSDLGRSSPGNARKEILRQHSAAGVESFADKSDDSERVATSFQILSAANCSSGKHLAFKNLYKLTSVAEEARVRNPAESPSEGSLKDNDNFVNKPEAVVAEKLSREDVENDQIAQDSTAENPEINRFKLHENSKTPLRVAKPSPRPSPQDCFAINHHSESIGSSPFSSPALPLSPSDGPRANPDTTQPCDSMTLHLKDNFKVQRTPKGVGVFPRSVMTKEARASNPVSKEIVKAASAHGRTIKEIEDRSMFFLAVKADVDTKGDFVQYLATKIRDAEYSEIEDVVAFVKWVDKELSLLVDERAVVKHFDWPENRIDALREAAFHYQDLKKLDVKVNSYEPEPNTPGDVALNSMLVLQERTEEFVNNFVGSRDLAMLRYTKFNIPTYWMLDSGLVGKIKLASVQLAQKYMKRVLLELEHLREPSKGNLLVKAARFAFKVHQFAGGFDSETLSTFNDLKHKGDMHDSKEVPTIGRRCDSETLSTFNDLKNRGDTFISKEQPTSLEGCA